MIMRRLEGRCKELICDWTVFRVSGQRLTQKQAHWPNFHFSGSGPTALLSTGQPWRPGKASAEMQSVAGDPHKAQPQRQERPEQRVGESEPGGSSTGSSSLLAEEEVTRCLA